MSLISIIQKCLSSDNNIRNENEKLLQSKVDENYSQILLEMVDILTQENQEEKIRQYSGTFIKYLFSHNNYLLKWENNDQNFRDSIKQKILACLASNSQLIRNATSMAIASICKYEIPRKNWNNIIDILNSTALNKENINYRITSLIAIRNIIDELNITDLTKEEINKLLTAITLNINSNLGNEIFINAIKSFYCIIPFTESNFSITNERNFIINLLLNYLDLNNNLNQTINSECKIIIFECLIEIIRNYYNYLFDNMRFIADVTFQYFNNSEYKISILSIEFWCSLTDYEKNNNIKDKISNKFLDSLVNNILSILDNRNINYENDNEEEWQPIKAAVCLIENLSDEKFFNDKILIYIGNKLRSNDYIEKDSAYKAFFGLLKNSKLLDENIIISSINQMYDELLNKNNNPLVIKTILNCLNNIYENNFNLIENDKNIFDNFMNNSFKLLQIFSNNKIMIYQILLCLYNGLNNISINKSNFLNSYANDLFNILIKLAYAPNANDHNNNITILCFCIFDKIILKSSNEISGIIYNFISILYDLLEKSFDIKNFDNNIETQKNYQCYILSTLSFIFPLEKIKLNSIQINGIYNLIIKFFTLNNNVIEEGLHCLTSMALNNPIDFYSYLENTSKYIEISLNSINDVNLCKNGIISFSELIRAYNEKYISYINKIFPLIYEIISNKNSDKILKANVFLVFTDVFNINNEEIYKFYKPTMDAIINAMSASLKQSLNNEEEDEIIEYFILLRERIFESLNLIYTYLGNFNKNQEFEIYVDNILKYINIICERKYSMTKDTAKFIIGIFGDVSDVFIENVKNNFNKNNIDYLINIILENKNNNNNNDMNDDENENKEFINWFEQSLNTIGINYNYYKL